MPTPKVTASSDVTLPCFPEIHSGNTSLQEVVDYNGSESEREIVGCSSYDDAEYEDYVNPLEAPGTRVIFIILYAVVFTLAFVGNLVVLTVVLKHRRMRTITNFFLANLAVADLAVSIFCVLPNLSLNLTLTWHLGRVMCKLFYFVQSMSYTASVTILTVISAERYFAIIYPLRSKQMTTMCLLRVAVVMVWFLAAASGVPYLIVYDQVSLPRTYGNFTFMEEATPQYFCIPTANLNMKVYATCNFIIAYLVPLILMSVMYTRISIVLWKTSKQGQSLMRGVVKSRGNSSHKVDNEIKILVEPPKARVNRGADVVDESDGLVMPRSHCMASVQSEEHVNSREDSDDDKLPGYRRHGNNAIIKPQNVSHHHHHHLAAVSYRDQRTNSHVHHSPSRRNTGVPMHDHIKKQTHLQKEKKPEKALMQRRKVIRLLITVVVSFALCVLPYHVRVMWQLWAEPHLHDWQLYLPLLTFIFYYLNSGINPVLYAFMSDKFRQSLRDTVRCESYRRQRQNSFSMKTLNSGVHTSVT